MDNIASISDGNVQLNWNVTNVLTSISFYCIVNAQNRLCHNIVHRTMRCLLSTAAKPSHPYRSRIICMCIGTQSAFYDEYPPAYIHRVLRHKYSSQIRFKRSCLHPNIFINATSLRMKPSQISLQA